MEKSTAPEWWVAATPGETMPLLCLTLVKNQISGADYKCFQVSEFQD
ncbi:hypothetical protein LAV79_15390 [Peribacillus butanolivorans]